MKILYPYIFLVVGGACVIMFHVDMYLPIWMSVLVLTGVTLFLIASYKSRQVGILILFLWLVFSLPFIHVIPYLWFDFDNGDRPDFWALFMNPYTVDHKVIQLASMIGAVAGIGFALGVSMHRKVIATVERMDIIRSNSTRRTLVMPMFWVWLLAGLLLSWLAAPSESLLTAAYSTSETRLDNANFGSAWMVSYTILTFVFCDAMLDQNIVRRRLKIKITLIALAYVVIGLQLLRGDRESLPLVFGLCLISYYWAAPFIASKTLHFPWRKIILLALAMVIISTLIGAVRSGLTGVGDLKDLIDLIGVLYEADIIGFERLFHGTWSAVFLTPMSVAGDHIYNLLDLKLGQTYVDLILSMPPGFVADAVGYTRPITGLVGPAWEMRYGIGGTHASVVPFMNFSMTGVLLVTAVWASAFSGLERRAMRQGRVSSLTLLCVVCMAAPHWLWYGEKSIMNALIMWLLLRFFYSISLSIGRMSRPIITNTSLAGSRVFNGAN